jgi:hypothetical protein
MKSALLRHFLSAAKARLNKLLFGLHFCVSCVARIYSGIPPIDNEQ